MNFGEYVQQGFRMLLFDSKAIKKTLVDKNAKSNSFRLFFLLSAVAGVLGGAFYYLLFYFVTRLEGDFPAAPPAYHFFIAAILIFVLLIIVQAVCIGLTHLFAKLFGTKKNILPYFAVFTTFGFASTVISIPVMLIGLVPILGTLINFAFSIYVIVLSVVIVRESYAISTGKATIVVLLPAVLLLLVAIGCLAYFGVLSPA